MSDEDLRILHDKVDEQTRMLREIIEMLRSLRANAKPDGARMLKPLDCGSGTMQFRPK